MTELNFKLPLPQKISGNSVYAGMHWSKRKKLADDFHLAVWASVRQQKIIPWKDFPAKVHYQYHLSGRMPDISNLGLMTKLVEDGLVKAGIFPDDSYKYIREITISGCKIKSPQPHIKVLITPCA